MTKSTFVLGAIATAIAVSSLAAPSFARDKPTHEQMQQRMMDRLDTNGDKKISPEEVKANTERAFKAFDVNADGQVSPDEIKTKRAEMREARKAVKAAATGTEAEKITADAKLKDVSGLMMPGMREKMFKRLDTDKNGTLSLAEVDVASERMFKRRDTNVDGFIDASDTAPAHKQKKK